MARPHRNCAFMGGLLLMAAACLFTAPAALAAAPSPTPQATPAPKPRPKPTGYASSVQDEVDLQNLTCDQLLLLQTKLSNFTLEQVTEDILNEPQNTQETSLTLFGTRVNAMILQASNLAPPCVKVVPRFLKETQYHFDPTVCGGPGTRDGAGIVSLGMDEALKPLPSYPGELIVMGEFDTAARLKNCRH